MTLPDLAITDVVNLIDGWHGRIVCQTHHVLAQGGHAVIEVLLRHDLWITAQYVGISFAHGLL